MTSSCATAPLVKHRGSLRHYAGSMQPLFRVIAFPWCGAGASVYRKLAMSFPDYVELLSVQLPGREDRYREPRLVRMEQIVDQVIGSIVSVFDRPLVLFGHSMGALVAYEVALALRKRTGREPMLLVVSGHGAPHSPRTSTRQWHTADESEFIANIRQLGGTPQQLLADHPMMRAFVPVLKADYEVVETYAPVEFTPLSCPLIACAGNRDNEVTSENMQAWLHYTAGPSRLRWFDGDHFYLSSQPEYVAREMREWITHAHVAQVRAS